MKSQKTFYIIFISFFIVIIFFLFKNFMDKYKLKKEVNNVYESIISTYDYKEVYDKINEIKTKDGYALIEEASKDYLFEVFKIIINYDELVSKEKNIIEIGNYKQDGPKFINTYQYINDYKNNLNNIKNEFDIVLDEEYAFKYISEKGLKTSYEKIYKNLKFYKEIETLKKERIELIDNKLEKLELESKIIDYLINNSYTIKNNKVIFKNNNSKYIDLIDEYNKKYLNE